MSYFEEIEFKIKEDPNIPKKSKPERPFNPDKLKLAIEKINRELECIKTGHSNLVAYAINSGRFGSPAENRLKIFASSPTEENYKALVEITAQDFNALVSKHFADLINETREETTNE